MWSSTNWKNRRREETTRERLNVWVKWVAKNNENGQKGVELMKNWPIRNVAGVSKRWEQRDETQSTGQVLKGKPDNAAIEWKKKKREEIKFWRREEAG